MGRTGARIAFPAEAGSENWRVPVTRPLLSSRFYTEPNQNHVCASHPTARPGSSASAAVTWTTCDRRKRSTPPLAPLLLESLSCITPRLSRGGEVESDSFLSLVPVESPPHRWSVPFLRAFIQPSPHDGCDWGSTVVCPRGQRSFPDTQAATG